MPALLAYIRAESTTIDAPFVPATWDKVYEDNRWSTLYPLGRESRPDVCFHARLMLRNPSLPQRAFFICIGTRSILDLLAARITVELATFPWFRTWLTLPLFRADAATIASELRAAWPDERPRDASGTPIGVLVALHRRMAGFASEDAET